ncbi:MAG: neutral/alkaline non-lysosomal ceramidase N-terminal domain-containing protein [Planctomycetaceae bacterium]|nr:neutral/alkaline non-lysosomal ceramidase N-terminal domain-containing protein [Planctomycetaceae bacterium]
MNGLVLALAVLAAVGPGEFRAGVARKVITPTSSVWMSGYACRKAPSEGVLHDLWAKALALQDERGERVVIVTMDIIGIPREMSDEIALRLKKRHGLERRQIVLNAAHTHTGPLIWPNLRILYDLSDADQQRLIEYRSRLISDVIEVVDSALSDLKPATLAIGHGSVGFGANRRAALKKKGKPVPAPVDHDVPVVRINSPDGKPRAVFFGYACHNTTFTERCRLLSGDYAGFAQIELERAMPGTTAMFLMLCGADQDPKRRGTAEIAAEHGKSLAAEVQHVLADVTISPAVKIRTAYEEVTLDVAPVDRSVFDRELKGDNPFRQRRASAVLADLDAGRKLWRVSVPVQAVGLGDHAAMLTLGGEPVVDYSLRLKREYAKTNLIVAGYSNDVMCYVPSLRVLKEGGYEPIDNMIYYGRPGPFTDSVEDRIVGACHRVLSEIDVK